MKRKIISTILVLSMLLVLLPTTAMAAVSFTDVKTTDWFYDAVQFVSQRSIMSGTSDRTFSPNTTATRGMVVTILYRMEGFPSVSRANFSDVSSNAYYANAVSWASKNGIMSGYGNGKFGPDDAMTREQLATVLYRYTLNKGYDIVVNGYIHATYQDGLFWAYEDVWKISDYAEQAMTWAVGRGIISGSRENYLYALKPNERATRAQVATILMRLYQEIIQVNGESNRALVSTGVYENDDGWQQITISEIHKDGTIVFDASWIRQAGVSGTAVLQGDTAYFYDSESKSGGYLKFSKNGLLKLVLTQTAHIYLNVGDTMNVTFVSAQEMEQNQLSMLIQDDTLIWIRTNGSSFDYSKRLQFYPNNMLRYWTSNSRYIERTFTSEGINIIKIDGYKYRFAIDQGASFHLSIDALENDLLGIDGYYEIHLA